VTLVTKIRPDIGHCRRSESPANGEESHVETIKSRSDGLKKRDST